MTDQTLQNIERLIFDNIDPSRTAVLAIDLQRWCFDPEFESPLILPASEMLKKNIKSITSKARKSGALVVWTRSAYTTLGPKAYPAWFREMIGPDAENVILQGQGVDSRGIELVDDYEVATGDMVVDKFRYSALLPISSDLHRTLEDRGVDTLVIVGGATNICCESTARDAMMLGYRVFFVSDATVAADIYAHRASLLNIVQGGFADVRTSNDLMPLFRE